MHKLFCIIIQIKRKNQLYIIKIQISHQTIANRQELNINLVRTPALYQLKYNFIFQYILRMFSGPRFLAYIYKPSPYYLRRMIPDQKRLEILKQISSYQRQQLVTHSNPLYIRANQLMKQQRKDQLTKYQNSFWWSPHYTPKNFLYRFVLPVIFVTLLMLYIRYIAQPRQMMRLKLKYNIRFPEMQKRGFLDGWYEQYYKKDKVLEFQMYSLQDVKRLHRQGLLTKTKQETLEKIQKKKAKFVRGNRDFVLEQFKTN